MAYLRQTDIARNGDHVFVLMVDFFTRVVVYLPESSQPAVDEVITASGAVPQMGDALMNSYLAKMADLIKKPEQVDSSEQVADLVVEQSSIEQSDGYWRGELFSLKLLAVIKGSDLFAVVDRIDNETGVSNLIELRQDESIDSLVVDEILQRQLRLRSLAGDSINLTLFEQNLLKSDVQ